MKTKPLNLPAFQKERSPEERVLLWALRSVEKGSPADPPPDGDGVDWQAVIRLSGHHGLLPLLHDRLKNPNDGKVPQREMAEIRRLYLRNTGRNLLLTRKLLHLIKLFSENGIDAIPFKGPTLAALAYGSVSMRRFCDLDILVRPRDMGRTADLLNSRGFVPTCRLSRLQQRIYRRFTCELGFVRPEENLHLDIHWRFAADYLAPGFSVIDPFDRSRNVPFEGGETAALPADILLLYLCLHGTFHIWTSLCHVSDIARVIEAGGTWDWEGLLTKGEETGLLRVLLLGLALARDLCGVRLPSHVDSRIEADARMNWLRDHAVRSLFSNRPDLPGFGEMAVFQMNAQDRLRDRIRYLLLRLFLPTVEDWKRIPLPDLLFPLYFLFRPLRLAAHILFHRRSPGRDQST
jgi:hypothetical protein